METAIMGKVTVAARLENLGDAHLASLGQITSDRIRAVDVADALIDTGAYGLFAPHCLIARLGILPFKKQMIKTANGDIEVEVYRAVRLAEICLRPDAQADAQGRLSPQRRERHDGDGNRRRGRHRRQSAGYHRPVTAGGNGLGS